MVLSNCSRVTPCLRSTYSNRASLRSSRAYVCVVPIEASASSRSATTGTISLSDSTPSGRRTQADSSRAAARADMTIRGLIAFYFFPLRPTAFASLPSESEPMASEKSRE